MEAEAAEDGGARKAADEAKAISFLRTLTTVSEQYRRRFRSYPGSLGDLATTNYVDGSYGPGPKSGFLFNYAGSANSWSCVAGETEEVRWGAVGVSRKNAENSLGTLARLRDKWN